MSAKSHESLKSIHFAEELLPEWARLLDVAARLCFVAAATQAWFSRFTRASGVDDARTILEHCDVLRRGIQAKQPQLEEELRRSQTDTQPAQIIRAWGYALDTMIQQARSHPTCAWIVAGNEPEADDGCDGGEITLRRV